MGVTQGDQEKQDCNVIYSQLGVNYIVKTLATCGSQTRDVVSDDTQIEQIESNFSGLHILFHAASCKYFCMVV